MNREAIIFILLSTPACMRGAFIIYYIQSLLLGVLAFKREGRLYASTGHNFTIADGVDLLWQFPLALCVSISVMTLAAKHVVSAVR